MSIDRTERINQIMSLAKNPLNGLGAYTLEATQYKLGRGYDYILFDAAKDGMSSISTNVQGLGNPGFRFSSLGSEFRTGKELFVQTPLDKITFGDGMSPNPKSQFLPPNIVNFYPPMIPSMGDTASLAMISGALS